MLALKMHQFSLFQSTHPLRDATVRYIYKSYPNANFNPRTPYGMRLYYHDINLSPALFQSTHPLRDATSATYEEIACWLDFNPRTPYGMRPSKIPKDNDGHYISIHAPLTGCDMVVNTILGECALFQSTHPLRDATW